MEVIALSINRNIRIPQSDANKLLIKRVFWEGGAKPIMVRTADLFINFNYIKQPMLGCFRVTKMSVSWFSLI